MLKAGCTQHNCSLLVYCQREWMEIYIYIHLKRCLNYTDMFTSSKSAFPCWRNCSVSYVLVTAWSEMSGEVGDPQHEVFSISSLQSLTLTRGDEAGAPQLTARAVQGRTVAVLRRESDSACSGIHAHLAWSCSVLQKRRLPAV